MANAVKTKKAKVPKKKGNHDNDELVPFNFYVPQDFHTRYKVYAALSRRKMVDILKESFQEYTKNHPMPGLS